MPTKNNPSAANAVQEKSAQKPSRRSPASRTISTGNRTGFARAKPYANAGLTDLYDMLDLVREPAARTELSRITRQKLREAFPAASDKRGIVPLANGLKLKVDLGDLFGAEMYIGHFNEHELLDAIVANLPDRARTIDVGANFGIYATHCAHAVGDEGCVVAFEPLESAAELLAENVKDNGLSGRVEIIQKAVAEKPGKATFFVAADGAFSGLHDTARSAVIEEAQVDVVSLDTSEIVAALGPVDFLKIDVEGHEGEVLAGASETITRSPNLLIAFEYSHKNLTEQGKTAIRKQIGMLLGSGFRGSLVRNETHVVSLSDATNIPTDMSGTILLAAPECQWVDGLLTALGESARQKETKLPSPGLGLLLAETKALRSEIGSIQNLAAKANIGDPALPLVDRLKPFVGEAQKAQKKADALIARLTSKVAHSTEANTALKNMLKNAADKQAAEREAFEKRRESDAAERTALEKRTLALEVSLKSFRDLSSKLNAKLETGRQQIQSMKKALKDAADKQEAEREAFEKRRESDAAERTALEKRSLALELSLTSFRELSEKLNAKLEAGRQQLQSMKEALLDRERQLSEAKAFELKAAELEGRLDAERTRFRRLQQIEALRALGKSARIPK
jgi:FkbM family methyltransferase